MYFVNSRVLKKADGTLISALDLTNGNAIQSEAINVERNVGFFSLLVTENKAGGTGDVDIYAEYSMDGTNWYRAYTTSGAVLTVEPNIVDTLQNVSRWIVVTARLAKYVRIVFDPDADSTITARLSFQEDV